MDDGSRWANTKRKRKVEEGRKEGMS